MPSVAGSLKEDLTIHEMDRRAGADSDTGAAIKMREAKHNCLPASCRAKSHERKEGFSRVLASQV
jgi:hypothetical protein